MTPSDYVAEHWSSPDGCHPDCPACASEGRRIAFVALSHKRNEHGEYVCRAYSADGKRMSECDYHTDDLDDAVATREAMMASQREKERHDASH